MTRGIRPEQVWGLGLATDVEAAISAALGSGYVLRNWPIGQHPGERDLNRAAPLVVFVVKEAWDALSAASRKRLEEWEVPQRVLVLSAGQSVSDFDELLEKSGIVVTPGSGFGAAGEGYFRITAFGSWENASKAVSRLKTGGFEKSGRSGAI